MSLTEVLEAVRVLTPEELAKVRALIESLDDKIQTDGRVKRFSRLRGSTADKKISPVTLEDLRQQRREMWRGYMKEDFES